MKLNYKKTIFVGFAFFLITAFWQAYDAIIPLILTNLYKQGQDVSGLIMSFDNILAVFMLPLFGNLSDRTRSPMGKRTPFVLFGTVCAVICFISLGIIKDVALLPLFIVVLLLTLISMAVFRSPAVALMPDVTVKPLRSKGNAVINLMGTAGGLIALLLGKIFNTGEEGKTDFLAYIIAVSAVMLVGLAVFLLTVKENKWVSEMEADSEKYGLNNEPCEVEVKEKRKLTRPEMCSLILILSSVALWYIGYNAVTSKYSVYATNVLGFDFNMTLMVANIAAIVAYIPVGIISSKIGRKKSILAGVAMLTSAFVIGNFLVYVPSAVYTYPVFALAGIGWATINVNSFPMAVELASGSDVGKYTGYYYTASMAAQIVAPILSGVLIERVFGWGAFFPIAALFTAASFVTMLCVRHGDSKPTAIEALDSLGADND